MLDATVLDIRRCGLTANVNFAQPARVRLDSPPELTPPQGEVHCGEVF